MRLEFTVYTPDIPYRERAVVRNGHVGSYKPRRQMDAQILIRHAALEAAGPFWTPLDGPLYLWVTVYRPFPKSMSQKKRATAFPITRPDLDNTLKLVCDALAPTFNDDAQIVSVRMQKHFTDGPARIEVELEGGDG